MVVLTGVFAAAVSVGSFVAMTTGRRRLLTVVNLVGTIVHETGHALAAAVAGGKVAQVRVGRNPESGSTTHSKLSWLPDVVMTAAGYAMPTLAGLGAASLLHHGKTAAVLALTTVVMALLLVFVCRDLVTICDVIAVGGLAFVTLRWAPALLQNCFAYAETWLLLTSEIAGVAVIVLNHAHGQRGTDDADILAKLTLIPAVVWVAGWFVLIGWGLWTAIPLLWP
ncbi:M50 family metallopeptidase [Kibdelosporangium lantanae]